MTNNKQKIYQIALYSSIFLMVIFALLVSYNKISQAELNLADKLAGRMLLQVENNGESWYVNPATKKRHFLNRPVDAFQIMQSLGLGITNNDLNKIPVGIIEYDDNDDDNDGLKNRLEIALGTDINNTDTDNDGYSDYEEIINNFNPLSELELTVDDDFINNNKGKILLQIENHGEAWYIDPVNKKRYYLGRPIDAFQIMQEFGLGITNDNINQITIAFELLEPIQPEPTPPPGCTNCTSTTPVLAMIGAANAFATNNPDTAKQYFIADMHRAIEYTFEYQGKESLQLIADLLLSSHLDEQTENLAIYKTNAYIAIMDAETELIFNVEKGEDGIWRLRSL